MLRSTNYSIRLFPNRTSSLFPREPTQPRREEEEEEEEARGREQEGLRENHIGEGSWGGLGWVSGGGGSYDPQTTLRPLLPPRLPAQASPTSQMQDLCQRQD